MIVNFDLNIYSIVKEIATGKLYAVLKSETLTWDDELEEDITCTLIVNGDLSNSHQKEIQRKDLSQMWTVEH